MIEDPPTGLEGDLEPVGPNGIARVFADEIAKLEAARAVAAPGERRKLDKRLRDCRRVLAFCKTRAGYVDPGPSATNTRARTSLKPHTPQE